MKSLKFFVNQSLKVISYYILGHMFLIAVTDQAREIALRHGQFWNATTWIILNAWIFAIPTALVVYLLVVGINKTSGDKKYFFLLLFYNTLLVGFSLELAYPASERMTYEKTMWDTVNGLAQFMLSNSLLFASFATFLKFTEDGREKLDESTVKILKVVSVFILLVYMISMAGKIGLINEYQKGALVFLKEFDFEGIAVCYLYIEEFNNLLDFPLGFDLIWYV